MMVEVKNELRGIIERRNSTQHKKIIKQLPGVGF
jgi:hypothetical protein